LYPGTYIDSLNTLLSMPAHMEVNCV